MNKQEKVAIQKRKLEYHNIVKREAESAIEELLQDRGVPIETTLESMEELYCLIDGHIEGLRDDIKAGRH
jgi:hypothetical protein